MVVVEKKTTTNMKTTKRRKMTKTMKTTKTMKMSKRRKSKGLERSVNEQLHERRSKNPKTVTQKMFPTT